MHVEAVKSFKASADFQSELTKGAMSTYNFGFKECLDKVKEAFLDLDQIMPSMLETSEHDEGETDVPTLTPTPDQALEDAPLESMWRAYDFYGRIVYFKDQDKILKYYLELLHELWDSPSSTFLKIAETSFDVAIEMAVLSKDRHIIKEPGSKNSQASR
ncbi:hypothetical protein COCNU_scaffold002164G000010 [Cocos nucifera]|nr:hypothetical protein [Cocos nucifera]